MELHPTAATVFAARLPSIFCHRGPGCGHASIDLFCCDHCCAADPLTDLPAFGVAGRNPAVAFRHVWVRLAVDVITSYSIHYTKLYDDRSIILCGYEPGRHRKFLVDYFTGNYDNSHARGLPFGQNPKTGDSRISGSLASLVGLEYA